MWDILNHKVVGKYSMKGESFPTKPGQTDTAGSTKHSRFGHTTQNMNNTTATHTHMMATNRNSEELDATQMSLRVPATHKADNLNTTGFSMAAEGYDGRVKGATELAKTQHGTKESLVRIDEIGLDKTEANSGGAFNKPSTTRKRPTDFLGKSKLEVVHYLLEITEIGYLKMVAMSCTDKQIRIWNMADINKPRVVFCLNMLKGGVHQLKFFASYQVLLVAGYENSIPVFGITPRYFDVNVVGRLVGHVSIITAIDVIEGTPMVVTADDSGCIKTWDIRQCQCYQTIVLSHKTTMNQLLGLENLNRVAFIGSRVNFLEFDKFGRGKNPEEKQQVPIRAELNQITGELLVCTNSEVKFLDGVTGRLKKIYAHLIDQENPDEITVCKPLQRNLRFMLGDPKGDLYIYNYNNGEKIYHVTGHQQQVFDVRLDTYNKLVISAGADARIMIMQERQGAGLKLNNGVNDDKDESEEENYPDKNRLKTRNQTSDTNSKAKHHIHGKNMGSPSKQARDKKENLKADHFEPIRVIKNAHGKSEMICFAVSVYHNLIASAADQNNVFLYDYEFGKFVHSITLPSNTHATCLEFINGVGILLISTTEGMVYFVELPNKEINKPDFICRNHIDLSYTYAKKMNPSLLERQYSGEMRSSQDELSVRTNLRERQSPTNNLEASKSKTTKAGKEPTFFSKEPKYQANFNQKLQLEDITVPVPKSRESRRSGDSTSLLKSPGTKESPRKPHEGTDSPIEHLAKASTPSAVSFDIVYADRVYVDLTIKGDQKDLEDFKKPTSEGFEQIAMSSCTLYFALQNGHIAVFDLGQFLRKYRITKHSNTRLNYNPYRTNVEDCSTLTRTAKGAITLKSRHELQSDQESSKLDYSLTNLFFAHKGGITSFKLVRLPKDHLLTTGNDRFVRIYTTSGECICAWNVNHPLPTKWNLELDLLQDVRSRTLFALKVIQTVFKRYYNSLYSEGKIFDLKGFIKEFKELEAQGRVNSTIFELTQVGAEKKPNKEIKLMSEEYNPKDLVGGQLKELYKQELGGPSLKQLEAKRRLILAQEEWKEEEMKAKLQPKPAHDLATMSLFQPGPLVYFENTDTKKDGRHKKSEATKRLMADFERVDKVLEVHKGKDHSEKKKVFQDLKDEVPLPAFSKNPGAFASQKVSFITANSQLKRTQTISKKSFLDYALENKVLKDPNQDSQHQTHSFIRIDKEDNSVDNTGPTPSSLKKLEPFKPVIDFSEEGKIKRKQAATKETNQERQNFTHIVSNLNKFLTNPTARQEYMKVLHGRGVSLPDLQKKHKSFVVPSLMSTATKGAFLPRSRADTSASRSQTVIEAAIQHNRDPLDSKNASLLGFSELRDSNYSKPFGTTGMKKSDYVKEDLVTTLTQKYLSSAQSTNTATFASTGRFALKSRKPSGYDLFGQKQ